MTIILCKGNISCRWWVRGWTLGAVIIEGTGENKRKNDGNGWLATIGSGALILAILLGGVAAGVLLNAYWPEAEEAGTAGESSGRASLYEVGSIVTNIRTDVPGQERYIQLEVDLLLENDEAAEVLSEHSSLVRGEILRIIRHTDLAEVQEPEGLETLAARIKRRVNTILEPLRVEDVYFTEFLIQ